MAVSETEWVDMMTDRLQELLVKASQIKKFSSITPLLAVSELVEGDQPLLPQVAAKEDTQRAIVDRAARDLFYEIVASTSIDDPEFVRLWNLLDILQYCSDRGQCHHGLVPLLVEELLDSQSTNGCRKVFDYLESRREVMIAKFFDSNKQLPLLRSCNELLRRLSRAEDAVFCGRVFIFLFQSFPLHDKSSVNPRGQFHVENVTVFEDVPKSSDEDAGEMAIDSEGHQATIPEKEADKTDHAEPVSPHEDAKPDLKSMDIDTLYPIFWSLQHVFSNPPRLFDQKLFEDFRFGLEATLRKFKEVPTVLQSNAVEASNVVKRNQDDTDDDMSNNYNPKYLTSRDLFKLELSDLAFQRHILVQALILIDFLLSLTEKAKKQAAQLGSQKALIYSFTLSEPDAKWSLNMKKAIADYLQEGPDGKLYYRMVDTVLSRDKNWVRWKMEGCTPIQRPAVSAVELEEAKVGADRASATQRIRANPMGALDVDFLTDQTGTQGGDSLESIEKFEFPGVEHYIKKIQGDDLDLEMAMTDEETQSLEKAKLHEMWRGLRSASRVMLRSFDKMDDGRKLEALVQPEGEGASKDEGTAGDAPEGKGGGPVAEDDVQEARSSEQDRQVTGEEVGRVEAGQEQQNE